jgi:long-chain acyl-CoA synthetase
MTLHYTKGENPVEIGEDQHLTTSLWDRAAAGSRKEILKYYKDGSWRGLTWVELAERVREVAAGLIALGVDHGDRVAIMSGTRVEWTIAELAILSVGAVTVPIYETSSVDQVAWILSDSGAKVAIAEKADHAKRVDAARAQAPDLSEVFVIDDAGLDAIAERGEGQRDAVEQRCKAIRSSDLALIIYTSGTTGNPKGCMLTHLNLLSGGRNADESIKELLNANESTLLFLPLAHSFAQLIMAGSLEAEVTVGYARSVDLLMEDLQSFQPTFLLSVPRVFEKVFNTAQRKAEGPKAKVFDFAVSTSQSWSKAPNPLNSAMRFVADKLVYGKLRAALGGRVRYCVSGGAPLAPHLAHFFHAAGITILEGYGLTETSAASTCNRPGAMKIGTVGLPHPGVEMKVAEDGELLQRGPQVFQGYYHNEQATSEVIDSEGWFHTGDLGEIDDDGFIAITGRKKEIIVTAGGKNVSPAVLEERMKQHRLVSQVMVVGDNRPFVGALVTVDPDELTLFAKEHGLSGDIAELRNNETLRAEVQKAVDHANAAAHFV